MGLCRTVGKIRKCLKSLSPVSRRYRRKDGYNLIKLLELLAFAVSAVTFGYGAFHLFRKETPKYFQLYVCAAGCYMLEELWVIVNSLLGNGGQDGLVTVRLIGFFGCLCFMLSANVNEFDKVVDEGNNRKAKALAFVAPVILLALYALFAFSPANAESAAVIVTGLISISPALFAAYFSLKHLLLPEDAMGFLRAVKGIDILALIFYAANYVYPTTNLYCPQAVMSVYDLLLAGMLFGLIVLCRKGAVKWKALI